MPADARLDATLLLKEDGVVCGLEVAEAVFRELDPDVVFEPLARDGDRVRGEVARVSGNARALLTGERTALNLLGRLSGIATLTRRYVDAVAGTGATILDTRKTTPGPARAREARRAHRRRHEPPLRPLRRRPDQGQPPAPRRRRRRVASAVRRRPASRSRSSARRSTTSRAALDAGADTILLDNMTPAQLREAVGARRAAARRPRPPAASRSTRFARSPRPASTASPSAR